MSPKVCFLGPQVEAFVLICLCMSLGPKTLERGLHALVPSAMVSAPFTWRCPVLPTALTAYWGFISCFTHQLDDGPHCLGLSPGSQRLGHAHSGPVEPPVLMSEPRTGLNQARPASMKALACWLKGRRARTVCQLGTSMGGSQV